MPRPKGTQVENREVSREISTEEGLSLCLVSGWQEKQCQQIARMLMKMTCQTAGVCQLGGSWRPTHRTPRMTSCGFEDLAGPGSRTRVSQEQSKVRMTQTSDSAV